jgi:tRNA(fMet)-specific endonuclease VapC
MEGKVILLDTGILIDYFRKTNKQNSLFHKLVAQYPEFRISVITHFEILRGSNDRQEAFWRNILKDIEIVSYFPMMNYTALRIRDELKKKRKSISIEDLIIAATAVHLNFSLATLNENHFNLISGLELITPSSLQ